MRCPTVFFLLFGLLLPALTGCDTDDPLASIDVSIIDLVPGTGEEAVEGAAVTIHYVGKLDNGKVIDSTYRQQKPSLPEDTPITFTVGAERVIRGLERGVRGMKEGGKRRIIIPPQLAFGNEPQGCPPECTQSNQNCDACDIPAGSTLTFDVDLLRVRLP